jgi:hypothetical protein
MGPEMASARPRLRDAKGRFVRESKARPEDVKPDYDNHAEYTCEDVAKKHQISLSTLHRMQVENGWEPRAPRRIDPNDLLMKLFEVLELQIKDMEKTMAKAGSVQANVLGKMVGTLDRMIALKNKSAASAPSKRLKGPEIDALRAKIAERIAEFSDV